MPVNQVHQILNKNIRWKWAMVIAVKYGAISVGCLFLFQYLILDIHLHPDHSYAVFTLVILISMIGGVVFVRKNRSLALPEIKDPMSLLTRRELEIFELLIGGDTNKEMCSKLFIEKSTLKSHINRVYKKLQLRNRKQLIQLYKGHHHQV